MTLLSESKAQRAPYSSVAYGSLVAGIALMVGGELLCFFGAQSHARLRDTICHAIFYSGVVCILAGAILWRMRRR